jgi:uncharacterized protein (TIGR02246 family)
MAETDLRALRDELEVRNVVARLAQLADAGDLEDYVALFLPDASWEMPGGVRRGHDEIRAGGAARRAEGTAGPGSATRHLVSTVAVELYGDTAVVQSYWQFLTHTTTAPHLDAAGHYRDTLIRTDRGWRVARREITVG